MYKQRLVVITSTTEFGGEYARFPLAGPPASLVAGQTTAALQPAFHPAVSRPRTIMPKSDNREESGSIQTEAPLPRRRAERTSTRFNPPYAVNPQHPSASPRNILRLLWIASILVVATGSLLPGTSAPIRALNALHITDKVEHFFAYAFLAFLPALHERRRFTLLAALGAILLGIALEFAQLFAADRTLQLSDMQANVAGVCLGLLAGVRVGSVAPVRLLLARTTP